LRMIVLGKEEEFIAHIASDHVLSVAAL
jgi:hypothetical protein